MAIQHRRRLALVAVVLSIGLVLPASTFASGGSRTLEGRLVSAHGEDYSNGAPRAVWYDHLVTADGEVELQFSGDRPSGFLNGARVRVTGSMRAGALAVGNGKADAKVVSAAAATTGDRRVAVLLVKFAEENPGAFTAAQAEGVIFSNANSVANYFAEESYGLLTMTGDVFGYFTISINTSVCDYNDIASKARAAATAAGVNLSNYTQIQYVQDHLSSCKWSGLAYLPGRDSWLNQALNLRVSAHELSHNFGVHHASAMSCTEGGVRVTLSASSTNCTSSEYGDPMSVMGSAASRHTHNQQLASLGWITGSNLVTITADGTYQVGVSDDPDIGAPRGVRIPRGDGTWFYLELRMAWGTQFENFAPDHPAVNGVAIRLSRDWTTIIQSQLLDTTPATTSFTDAPLLVGQSFFDPLSTVNITTVAVADGIATVDVWWGASGGDSVPPSTPGSLGVAATGASTARASWAASSDNVGVVAYDVYRDGALRGSTTGTQYDDTGLVSGDSYLYEVVARDAAGNESSPASTTFVMPDPDVVAPSTPTNLTVTRSTKGRVNFEWDPSTDNVGVAGYQVFRNGVLVATVTDPSWADGRQRTNATYYVKAFDDAGNVSGASNSVVVSKK